jgi:hypothetical protein
MTDPINWGNNLGLFYLIGFFKPDKFGFIVLVFRSPKEKKKKTPVSWLTIKKSMQALA